MDPILSTAVGYIAKPVISFASPRIRDAFLGTPKEQAIQKCINAGLDAIEAQYLPEIKTIEQQHWLDCWALFFKDADVQQSLAVLLRSQEPGMDDLQYLFEKNMDPKTLPGPPLKKIIHTFEAGFLFQAEAESSLHDQLELSHLRQILDVSTATLSENQEQKQIQQKILEHLTGDEKKVAQARLDYLNWLNNFCQNLPLGALGLGGGLETEFQLDNVYIDLNTRTRVEDVKFKVPKKKSTARYSWDEQLVPALTAYQNCPKLVLLGDPGSGKSTFVKMLCAKQIGVLKGLDKKPWPGVDPKLLPLFVTLRDLVGPLSQLTGNPDKKEFIQLLEQEIERQLAEAKALDFKKEVLQKLTAGQALLVLDGLDELPQAWRDRVFALVKAVIAGSQPVPIVLTCRIRSYDGAAIQDSFQRFTLADFNQNQIEKFVQGWYTRLRKVGKYNRDEAKKQTSDLISATRNKKMQQLAGNPMLLTTMAIIHQKETKLPDQRVELYNMAVDVLLRRWFREKKIPVSKELKAEILDNSPRLREIMERLAYAAHCVKGDGDKQADLPWKEAVDILTEKQYIGDFSLAGNFLDYVDQRSGLLVGRGGEPGKPAVYSFPHRQFQEYLAGCYLISQRDRVKKIREKATEDDYWGEAVALGLEELWYVRKSKNECFELMYAFSPAQIPKSEHHQRIYLWGSRLAVVAGADPIASDSGGSLEGAEFLENVRAGLPIIMQDILTPIERADAGNALATLGDQRPGICDVDAMEFCRVPGGDFYMGDNYKLNKTMQYDFSISRFPVTQAQFKIFVQDKGYENADWWTKEGWQWRNEQKITGPETYGSEFELSNHPVVGVSWYEVAAFANWLTDRYRKNKLLTGNVEIRLPTETEWEKAARGEGKRNFPWGDDKPDPNRANYGATHINVTSPVGCFPSGTSPYGVEEMSGNVGEWTSSKEGSDRIIRGGSWLTAAERCRVALRNYSLPGSRYNNLGFRLAHSL